MATPGTLGPVSDLGGAPKPAVEEWRTVPGDDVAEVSNWGAVRTRGYWARTRGLGRRWVAPQAREPYISAHGYRLVFVGPRGTRPVHHLVLEAFVGPRPTPRAECCHWDGDPSHNWPGNLRWGTRADNAADKRRHGTHNNTKRETCRRRGHLLVEPNLRPWTTAHGGRGCLACHRAAGQASNYRRKGVPFDRDAYADRMYAQLMALTVPVG